MENIIVRLETKLIGQIVEYINKNYQPMMNSYIIKRPNFFDDLMDNVDDDTFNKNGFISPYGNLVVYLDDTKDNVKSVYFYLDVHFVVLYQYQDMGKGKVGLINKLEDLEFEQCIRTKIK